VDRKSQGSQEVVLGKGESVDKDEGVDKGEGHLRWYDCRGASWVEGG
jgi:hypothetical protein